MARIMKWKRHSVAEISAKLAQGDELAANGKLQSEIAEALGISVMTYHRWRKMLHGQHATALLAGDGGSSGGHDVSMYAGRAAELRVENLRLRQLVTDLLLENIELQESVGVRAV